MYQLVLTSEHAGNRIPGAYAGYFDSDAARAALSSHRGWDPGSIDIATGLAQRTEAPLISQYVSRLLVEVNRSLDHEALWSEFSEMLTDAEKESVLERYWRAHRGAVRQTVVDAPPGTIVVQLGVHTFAPTWKERRRKTDIGILFDPSRPAERTLAARWQRALQRADVTKQMRIHRNRPYRGWTDGLTTTLRGEFGEDRYVGLELEVSQALVPVDIGLVAAIASTLEAAIE